MTGVRFAYQPVLMKHLDYRHQMLLLILLTSILVISTCSKKHTGEHDEDVKGQSTSEQVMPDQIKSPSFTFVRIKYSGRRGWQSSWFTDYPDSDLNFSARFHEVTGIETDLKGKVLELTDPDLKQYPFIYMAEGGGVLFSDEEVMNLRQYLLGGGFLVVDDFWGEQEWYNFYYEIKRVFPKREPVELALDHPIFHCFYNIDEKPQVPMIAIALRNRSTGITWEREDAKEPHYRGMFDDSGRMMAIFCHNTDLGDGWEREDENEYYYQEFSLKKAYPMGINIAVYALKQ